MNIWIIVLSAVALLGQTFVTPAQKQIALAETEIAKEPKRASGYNRLAVAYTRRARETSDTSYYDKGEEALKKSFEIEPDNLEARKTTAWLAMGKHDFSLALEIAKKLNAKNPDDASIYGILADANVELGNYDAAEKAVQTMLNLRPATVVSLSRASYLRELFGDLDGAIDLMSKACEMAGYDEREDRAWMLTQVAQLERKRGNRTEAERVVREALQLFPGYHYALGALSRIMIDSGKFEEAVVLEQERFGAAPHAENGFALAVAQHKAGHLEESKKSFQSFELNSLRETESKDNSNHELIVYYADYADQPEKALEIAKREVLRRSDVHTLDAYAWALHVNGKHEEASKQMKRALAVGVKDPDILVHARSIAEKVTR